MTNYKIQSGGQIVTLTGLTLNGLVRSRHRIKPHNGPTIELTVTSVHDGVRCFNVPLIVENLQLRKLLASYSCFLSSAECRTLKSLMMQFAKYVADNHGWSKPYRHNYED